MYFNQQTLACACVFMVKNDEKTLENDEKVPFPIRRMRGSCETNEEKRRKKCFSENILPHAHEMLMQKNKQKTTKFQMSDQRLGVNQLLGVTPNR